MIKEKNLALRESVLKSFFDMAFIEVTSLSREDVTQPIEFTNVFMIKNSSPEPIQLQFFFPIECKRMIVENIYTKIWSELPSKVIDDCILEMVNVVGGNFFSIYFGEQNPYDMGLPSLQFDDRDLVEGDDFYFKAENQIFKITIAQGF